MSDAEPDAELDAELGLEPIWPATRRGVLRDAAGVGLATGAYGLSFGAISSAAGLSVLQTCVLSLVMFTGGSQFAMVGVIGGGGAAMTGAATAIMLGVRNAFYAVRMSSILDTSRLATSARRAADDRREHGDGRGPHDGSLVKTRILGHRCVGLHLLEPCDAHRRAQCARAVEPASARSRRCRTRGFPRADVAAPAITRAVDRRFDCGGGRTDFGAVRAERRTGPVRRWGRRDRGRPTQAGTGPGSHDTGAP